MSAPVAHDTALSAECALAKRKGYADVHGMCTQTRDIPLPHSGGMLLVQRCPCACHRRP